MEQTERFDHYPRKFEPTVENVWRNKHNPQPGDWEHVCYDGTCPEGFYYVTAIDGGSAYFMAGPYKTHREALALVDTCRDIANKHDGRAWFMSWGTVRTETGERIGSINKAGLLPA